MRFKLDENLPREVAQLLADASHDAATVYEQNLSGATDNRLAAVCQNEQRILVTLDVDFADPQRYPPDQFAGLIVLRFSRQDKPRVLQTMQRILPLFKRESLKGRFWIVDESRVRIR